MKNIEVVLLINCLAWKCILMMDKTFLIKNTVVVALILLRLCPAFFGCGEPATSIAKTGPSFLDHSHSSTILSVVMTFLRKSGSLVVVWIKSLANAAQILPRHVSCQDPVSKSQTQWFLESPDQLLVLTLSVADLCWLQPVHIQHSQVFCSLQAFQRGSLSTDFWPSLKCLCHTCISAALTVSSTKGFWIIQLVSTEECSSLM